MKQAWRGIAWLQEDSLGGEFNGKGKTWWGIDTSYNIGNSCMMGDNQKNIWQFLLDNWAKEVSIMLPAFDFPLLAVYHGQCPVAEGKVVGTW